MPGGADAAPPGRDAAVPHLEEPSRAFRAPRFPQRYPPLGIVSFPFDPQAALIGAKTDERSKRFH